MKVGSRLTVSHLTQSIITATSEHVPCAVCESNIIILVTQRVLHQTTGNRLPTGVDHCLEDIHTKMPRAPKEDKPGQTLRLADLCTLFSGESLMWHLRNRRCPSPRPDLNLLSCNVLFFLTYATDINKIPVYAIGEHSYNHPRFFQDCFTLGRGKGV